MGIKQKLNKINPAKHAAYRIITNENVWHRGGANFEDMKSIFHKPQTEDDNKRMFLFGPERQETDDGDAFTWEKDIKDNHYHNVKSYEGILNPYNEYLVDERNRGLVEELAKHRYTPGININDEYMDPKTKRKDRNTPIFDDVHEYRLRFHYKDGKPVITSSDLYDFGKNYSKGYADVYKERGGKGNGFLRLEIQRRMLNAVGQPYKLIQKNIPIRFVDNPQGGEINRVNNFRNLVLDRLSDEDVAEIIGAGLIKPAVITNKWGGTLKVLK